MQYNSRFFFLAVTYNYYIILWKSCKTRRRISSACLGGCKMPYYCLTLHNSKCAQPNKMLINEQSTQVYVYSCDNTFKFKKNKKVCIIKC